MRGSALAAGYDLSASTDIVVPARGKALVKTDLAMAIPEGHYGRIGARRNESTCAHGGAALPSTRLIVDDAVR